MKAIVLGAHPPGNIGAAAAGLLEILGWRVDAPTIEELDVTSFTDVEAYDWNADAIVYCPGLCDPDWIWDQDFKSIQRQIDVTLTGAIATTAEFIRSNLGNVEAIALGRLARVVIIGSAAAETPHRGQVPYNAAKAGLRLAVSTLAREVHRHGFRIFLVEPGAVGDTPYARNAQEGARRMFPESSPEFFRGLAERGTFGRNLKAQEVGAFVAELLDGRHDWLAGRPIPYSGGPQ
jgi:NAD(P)-dependent dehydrogenase (short-subunit alcohol dehydrogenase family)